jgi:hypothetical protein
MDVPYRCNNLEKRIETEILLSFPAFSLGSQREIVLEIQQNREGYHQ